MRRLKLASLALYAVAAATLAAAAGIAAACSSFEAADDAEADGSVDGVSPPPPDGAAADGATADGSRDALASDAGYVTLVEGRTNITAVAIGGDTVYFADNSGVGGRIDSVPVAGGAVLTLQSTPFKPSAIAASAARVFWIDATNGKIGRVDKTGSNPFTREATKGPIGIAVYASRVLIANSNPPELEPLDMDVSAAGGPANAAAPPRSLSAAANADRAVWCEPNAGDIRQSPIQNASVSSVTSVTTSEFGCGSTATDSFATYWARQGAVYAKAKTSGAARTTLASPENDPFSLVADDQGLFWLTRDGLLRTSSAVQLDGGAARTLASGLKVNFADRRITAVALAPAFVVWATSDGKILRTSR